MTYKKYGINTYNALLFLFSITIFYLMYLVRDTIQDRPNYLEHFTYPVDTIKIEIGFKYYMKLFNILGIDPQISICLTSVFIYILLAKVWYKYVSKLNSIESILIFNFIMLTLFNHYVGTSIRMGLAIAIALYSSMKIIEGNKKYWIMIFLSIFFHYGISLFVLLFTWVKLFEKRSIRFHLFSLILIFLLTFIIFYWAVPILEFLNNEQRYSHYFDGKDMTDRIMPFTLLFLIGSLFLLLIKRSEQWSILYLLVGYSIPFIIVIVIIKVNILPKMLMPLIFLSAVLIINSYRFEYIKLNGIIRFNLLIIANVVAIMYALKMYQYY
ncbi:EpsG family protein [Arcobacter sp.]|uniref:EpsG family protein n=1 Tax=Arcobacter sp. TaxID=1872629 RepID=UPI003D120D14